MNERTQKQAELAALAQRFQLDSLHRALHIAGGPSLDALESESDRQSRRTGTYWNEKTRATSRNKAGLSHPSDQARLDTQQLTDANVRRSIHQAFPSRRRGPFAPTIARSAKPFSRRQTRAKHWD